MPYAKLLGRTVSLSVGRFGPPGAFLALDERAAGPGDPMLLLPASEVPEGTAVGDALSVFVYLDSDDRPIATLRSPKCSLGEVAFLEVKDISDFGAFVDWGLVKDLLVPMAEQTSPMQLGRRYPISVFVDRTGRLAGTMRVSEKLRERGQFARGEWVPGEAWRNDPELGLFVILRRQFVGLVPKDEPHDLSRGEAAEFRVANILPDGKIELSLRGIAHEEIDNDAKIILGALGRVPAPMLGDHSSPEEIRRIFGMSKKAFKRAVGRLFRQGIVDIASDGVVTLRQA